MLSFKNLKIANMKKAILLSSALLYSERADKWLSPFQYLAITS